jgi:hypothetical protein
MSSSPPDLSLEVIPSIPSSFEGDLVRAAGLQRGSSVRHSRGACPLRRAAGIHPYLVSY